MKEFDLAAAKKGARVCTRDGWSVRILCFDRVGTYNIVALTGNISHPNDCENINVYTHNGYCFADGTSLFDLMMADDDYLEKLERGEYGTPVWQEPHRIMTPKDTAKVTFLSPFDESYWRKQYAGMAMQGLCAANGTMKPASMVADVAVEYADALIEELKKEKE